MGASLSKLACGSSSDDMIQEDVIVPIVDETFIRMRKRLQSETTTLTSAEVDYWRGVAEKDALAPQEQGELFLLVGHKLYSQFLEKQGESEINNVLWFLRLAIKKTPRTNTGYGPALNSLGCAITARCKAFNKYDGIDEAISLQREALKLHPAGESGKSTLLSNLANALATRYGYSAHLRDLSEAITLHREALSDQPPGYQGRWQSLNNLAHALHTRYETTAESRDLNESITLNREALSLLSHNHPDRITSLTNLTSALQIRYEKHKRLKDLDEAIAMQRKLVTLESPDNPDGGLTITNLARSLQTRHEHVGEFRDLDEAIALNREAVSRLQPGHEDRPVALNNLAHALQTRYERLGDVKDVDEAITLQKDALALLDSSNPDRSLSLNNLANMLQRRYLRYDEILDLEEQIELHREALLLRPPGHRERATTLHNLASALHTRCERYGEMKDLDEAIVLHRDCLSLRPSGHPDRSLSLYNLANALRTRCQKFEVTRDLEEAISLLQEALHLVPQGSPDRSYALNYIACAWQARHARTGEMEELEEAIRLFREALSLQPPGHPYRSKSLHNLAVALERKCEAAVANPTEEPHDLHHDPYYQGMIRCAVESVEDPTYKSVARLQWAKHWATIPFAEPSFRLFMFSQTLLLLQQMLMVNPDLTEQQAKVLSTPELQKMASDAAADAVEAGEIELAVTLLDQGRSVLLGTLQRYRMPIDDLRAVDSGLADELQTVGSRLESLSRNNSSSELPSNAVALDHSVATQRQLIDRWDQLVEAVRTRSGFADFLSVPPFANLQLAADGGPIVFLNASQKRCDAMIMSATGPAVLVPLPGVSLSGLTEMYGELTDFISNGQQREQAAILKILRTLWVGVVSPVVDGLCSMGIKVGSRIWWCPSGVFSLLPLHAAGLYDGQPRTDLPRLFVSSYVSTATNLLRIMRSDQRDHRVEALSFPLPRHLFVGHTGDTLTHVAEEFQAIQSVKGLRTTALMEEEASRDATLRALDRHPWVHFSCHGMLRNNWPLESYFHLHGAQLTLQDIINARLKQAEFAFLSACHSAAVGTQIPDENIHLPAGLQFAGFHSVVGTMWEAYEEEGPEFVKDFYTKLVELGGRFTDTARALQFAINGCRKRCSKRGQGPERWAMYIHIGA